MKLPVLRFSSSFRKTALATLALGSFLVLAGAPAAKADSWEDCNRRVSYTEWRYHEAVEHSGPHSREARHWAHERHEAYEHLDRYRHAHFRDRDAYRYYHRDGDRDWDRR
jgi:hypothetical protein